MPGPNANGFASQWNIGLRLDTNDFVVANVTNDNVCHNNLVNEKNLVFKFTRY